MADDKPDENDIRVAYEACDDLIFIIEKYADKKYFFVPRRLIPLLKMVRNRIDKNWPHAFDNA